MNWGTTKGQERGRKTKTIEITNRYNDLKSRQTDKNTWNSDLASPSKLAMDQVTVLGAAPNVYRICTEFVPRYLMFRGKLAACSHFQRLAGRVVFMWPCKQVAWYRNGRRSSQTVDQSIEIWKSLIIAFGWNWRPDCALVTIQLGGQSPYREFGPRGVRGYECVYVLQLCLCQIIYSPFQETWQDS